LIVALDLPVKPGIATNLFPPITMAPASFRTWTVTPAPPRIAPASLAAGARRRSSWPRPTDGRPPGGPAGWAPSPGRARAKAARHPRGRGGRAPGRDPAGAAPVTPSRSGVLVVDKGAGVTSFQVVSRLRRLLPAPRVGHGGTLDPAATGVLPILIGEATKLAPYLMDHDKEYLAVIRLGIATDTQDLTGTVLAEARVDAV